MKLGVFAKTFEGTQPGAVLDAVAAAGFAAAQYNMACSGLASMPEAIDEGQACAVADAAKKAGIEIAAVSGTYNMIHPDQAMREAGHRRLAVLAERSHAMSTRLVTLCTGTRDPLDQWREHPENDTPEAWRDLLQAMETAIGIADRCDVDLGIEPELANVVNSAQKARRLIDEMRSPRIKIVLDPANLFETTTLDEQRTTVSAAIDLLADRIVMAHAKDRNPDGSFATAGKGVLDYAHYLGRLKAIGFTGSLITHGLAASEPRTLPASSPKSLRRGDEHHLRTSDGTRLNVDTAGEGMPVVFLHGLCGDAGQTSERFPPNPATAASRSRLAVMADRSPADSTGFRSKPSRMTSLPMSRPIWTCLSSSAAFPWGRRFRFALP